MRIGNAGSLVGFGHGWWMWVLLAMVGALLISVYGWWLREAGWIAALGVGLQLGGALGNLLDRLVFRAATDVVYAGWGPVWNLADVALLAGAPLAAWSLAGAGSREAKSARSPLCDPPAAPIALSAARARPKHLPGSLHPGGYGELARSSLQRECRRQWSRLSNPAGNKHVR